MKKGIIGRKIGMTQIFDEIGNVIPVTLIEAGPCTVSQVKNMETDGYEAVQLGFMDMGKRKPTKPAAGHFAKSKLTPKKHLKEFKLDGSSAMKVGDVIRADVFEQGDMVDVTGTTKGRGFTGAVKRWGYHMLRATHGTGPVHRQVGSMGANSSPSRVFKNKKMAGQYGNERSTVLNLKVVKIDAEKNLIAVKGAVPGAANGIVFIRNAVRP